jgi:hypothetical protein
MQPPPPPLSSQEIVRALGRLDVQEKQVQTVFSTGRITIHTGEGSSQLEMVTIGTRSPLQIKIELTHSWGRPISHILLKDGRLHVLSVPEKRVYVGPWDIRSSGTFLPAGLGSEQFWALARSFPVILDHHRHVSTRPNEIRLLDAESRTIEVIHLDPDTYLPKLVSFPKQGMDILYSKYENQKGMLFARSVKLSNPENKNLFLLHIERAVFNEPVPAGVFRLDVPEGFQQSPL